MSGSAVGKPTGAARPAPGVGTGPRSGERVLAPTSPERSASTSPAACASSSGGMSLGSITWAGAITVSQWQMFSS